MGIYKDFCGFSKRKTSITENKKIKRDMVKAIVKKLKAAGIVVDKVMFVSVTVYAAGFRRIPV